MAAQPQTFPSLNQAILPEFDHEMGNTRKSLERVPDDKLDFKPHAKSMSLSSSQDMNLLRLSFDVSTAPPTPQLKSREEILAAFDNGTAVARKAIAGAADAQFTKPWSLLSKGQTIFTLPRIAVIRSFILNHTIHHRAQLGVYLRLNDIPVPSIYGPSADEGNM